VVPAAPFLKWAGGKGQLLAQLEPLLPKRCQRYIEPFAGGAALFFHLHNLGRIPAARQDGGCRAMLNDANAELINCYRVVRDAARLPELIARLRAHAAHVSDPDYFYRVRAWDREPGFTERHGPVERAARTIFLNHACYNGLYRLNSKGHFNVPYGKWARPPSVFDEANLWACHHALQGVELRAQGFEAILDWAETGDFIYLDPPYDPLGPTAAFTTYTGTQFREADQRRLAEVFRTLDARGCRLLLTNSPTPLIRQLYRGYRAETLLAARAISSKPDRRGRIPELAVLNY